VVFTAGALELHMALNQFHDIYAPQQFFNKGFWYQAAHTADLPGMFRR
jgi:hypothetical protein